MHGSPIAMSGERSQVAKLQSKKMTGSDI